MDLSELTTSLQNTLGTHTPAILGALGILVLGWILAVTVRAGTRRLLRVLKLNVRIHESTEQSLDVESSVAAGVFWLILLLTLVGVFNVLDLEMISNPFAAMLTQVIGYLPRLIAGTVLVLLAWFVATVLRAIATKVLAATHIDEKLLLQAGMRPVSRNLGNVLFWLVILLFLPAMLEAFQLNGLLGPVQSMMNKLLDAVPNIFGAAVIGFVGWLVAKILRGLVSNLLAAAGTDRLAAAMGLAESLRVSRIAGTLVFIVVFVPTLIAALDAMHIEAISGPARVMLSQFFAAVPAMISAALILIVTFYVARFVAGMISKFLSALGIDILPRKLGLQSDSADALKPSDLLGWIAFFFAMLFATVEAANRLGFTQVRDVVTTLIKFSGDVLLGGAILIIGWWLANIAYQAIARSSNGAPSALAQIARVAILGLVTAMGLRAMGIANDIVNLAFALTLGSVAVAVALAFGLGGREAAGKLTEHWIARWRDQNGGQSTFRPPGPKTGSPP